MSLKFDEEFVETPTTIRGNQLHELAEMRLLGKDTKEFETQHAFNSYELFLIDSYVRAVKFEFEYTNAKKMVVEEKRNITIYDNSINLIVDVLLIGKKTASVIDLKTGNIEVDVLDNEQLYFYAYMAIIKNPNISKLRLSIFQKGKMKTFETTQSDVLNFFFEKEEVFRAINEDKLYYAPSDKACKFCGARETCMARAKWIIEGKK